MITRTRHSEEGSPAVERAKEVVKGWRQANTAARAGNLLTFAEGLLIRDITEFDSNPDLLNCADGVVDLRTGETTPHEPGQMMTKCTGVAYVKGATHADWDKVLEAIPEDVRDWYQIRMGQAITGHMTPDDLVIFQEGGGDNGKTTVMQAIASALGDYYVTVPHRAILANPSDHPTELMVFKGARFAVLEELPDDRRLAIVRIKMLTGTPRIDARFTHKDNVSFKATHTMFISTNHRPIVPEIDHGTWRRLALMRFAYKYVTKLSGLPGEKLADPGLRDRMATGADGRAEAVLAWLIEGARRWYAAGKVMPELPARIRKDTDRWKEDCNILVQFAADRLVFGEGQHVWGEELLQTFNEYLERNGHNKWSAQTFADRFRHLCASEGHEIAEGKHNCGRDEAHGELSRPPAMLAAIAAAAQRAGHAVDGFGSPKKSYRCWLKVGFASDTPDAEASQQESKSPGPSASA